MYELKGYYEDTDAGGVVYYANYLKYFERARTEYFAERGLVVSELAQKGIHFVVVRVEEDLRSPAVLGDIIQVETALGEFGNASLWVNYVVKRKADGKVLVEGRSKLACINDDFRVMKIPQELRDKLKAGQ